MKPTILIIEDNEQNMYMLSYLLSKSDYNVIEAYNGIEGLKIAHETHPEIILIDIQLPRYGWL
ncbi:response regulator [Lacinutrix neustonica]|uniref:Response regulator n=1 Tax=Lacinutrix neustonica TaxID=2980107 RepID=A0A9E8SDD4_9FLAO|nr:response regulator [Lacinutrix neustonica]WAC02313.1 response regulator [Lacinutrix neustonica]